MLVVFQMLGHLVIQGTFDQAPGQLLEQAILADPVVRVRVVGQQLVRQRFGYVVLGCGHGVPRCGGSVLPGTRVHNIQDRPFRERRAGYHASMIFPICLLLSISAWALAASRAGNT